MPFLIAYQLLLVPAHFIRRNGYCIQYTIYDIFRGKRVRENKTFAYETSEKKRKNMEQLRFFS